MYNVSYRLFKHEHEPTLINIVWLKLWLDMDQEHK